MESHDCPLNVKNKEANNNIPNSENLKVQNNPQIIQNIGISVEINNNNNANNETIYNNFHTNDFFQNNHMNNGFNNNNERESPKYNQGNTVLDVNTVNSVEKNKKDEQISNLHYSSSFFDGYQLKSKFLMKVYGIVFFEFVFIFALVLIFQIKSIKDKVHENPIFAIVISIISLIVYTILIIILECNPKLLNEIPTNYILLFLIAICLGFSCALIASCYSFEVVLGAITCVIAISLGSFIVVLIDKNRDITAWHFILGSIIFLGIQYSLMAAIFRSNYMIFLYDVIGALVYTIYIAFDAIIIRDALSIDDYIFGFFILTLDLVKLFVILLKILGTICGIN